MNINESYVGSNQTQPLEYKTLKDKLKPIFLETIDNLNNQQVDKRIHPTKVNTKKMRL